MTTTSATAPVRSTSRSVAQFLALAGGMALIADSITVTIINRSFDPIDSILFLTGLACTLGTGIALAVQISTRRHGPMRLLLAVGCFLAFAVILGGIATACDEFGRHTFPATDKGLHGEWSFFSIGICLTLLAWRLPTTQRRGASQVS